MCHSYSDIKPIRGFKDQYFVANSVYSVIYVDEIGIYVCGTAF